MVTQPTVSAAALFLLAVACGGTAAAPTPNHEPAPVIATVRAQGEACAFDQQCRSKSCSAARDSGTCGYCQDVRPLGASCTGPLEVCSYTATCAEGVCRTKLVDLGATCTIQPKGGSDCDSDLYCVPDASAEGSSSPRGTCRPKIPLGRACSVSRDGSLASLAAMFACAENGACVSGVCRERRAGRLGEDCSDYSCEQGLACDPATRRCGKSTLTLGSTCGLVGDRYIDGCPQGTVCGALGDVIGAPETCLAPPRVGERCIEGVCEDGAFCENPYSGNNDPRNCIPKRIQGAACKYQEECGAQLECRGGTCQPACK